MSGRVAEADVRLLPGSRLGPYEIVSTLGAGGMGVVYRARDARLDREVAVKVLPTALSTDVDRLRRFEQEARAAGALNHPNVLAVHDVGTEKGAPYLVTELLEGETLRERLGDGGLPVRKAVDYTIQVAYGLAAAHARGILHRDLKPENLFVTDDGRMKILDFGLAKLTRPDHFLTEAASTDTFTPPSSPGAMAGTAGYMSPEQVRGLAVDPRSDIFALGAVLYEMLSGRRAFRGATGIETLNAILKEDPPELTGSSPSLSPGIERVVRRCLEKNPEERFQSARDLAFALEAVSGASAAAPAPPASPLVRRAVLRGLGAAGLIGAGAVPAYFWGKEEGHHPPPTLRRLTFRQGAIISARFAPDGGTVVYGAAWDGGPSRLFQTRIDSKESRLYEEFENATILAISSKNEMALSLHRNDYANIPGAARGTLVRVPLSGGAPREVLRDVTAADWSPDGKELAILRPAESNMRLEYPIGKVLVEAAAELSVPRVSPRGDLVAFLEDADFGGAAVCVVDLAGRKTTLAKTGVGHRLAWAPSGDEIWYSDLSDTTPWLRAVSLSGRTRSLAQYPQIGIQDVSRKGAVLAEMGAGARWEMVGLPPGETRERPLSWLDQDIVCALSSDGLVLFNAMAGFVPGEFAAWLRPIDGRSPAIRLSENEGVSLSPDGKQVILMDRKTHAFSLAPTGPGETRPLNLGGLETTHIGGFCWFADGRRLLVSVAEAGHPARGFILDLAGGPARAVTPLGIGPGPISPDGLSFLAGDGESRMFLYLTSGGGGHALPGSPEVGDVHTFTADGRGFYVSEADGPTIKVLRRDIATGRRELWRTIRPADPTGVFGLQIVLGPYARAYVYNYGRRLSALYLIEGLR